MRLRIQLRYGESKNIYILRTELEIFPLTYSLAVYINLLQLAVDLIFVMDTNDKYDTSFMVILIIFESCNLDSNCEINNRYLFRSGQSLQTQDIFVFIQQTPDYTRRADSFLPCSINVTHVYIIKLRKFLVT
jgi:hypothetical protein